MKILLLNRSYYPNVGGIENSLYFLSQELHKQGHQVQILTQELQKKCEVREEFAEIVRYPRYAYNKLILPFLPLVEKTKIAKWIALHKSELRADVVICRDQMLGLAYAKVFPETRVVYIPAVIIKFYNKGIREAYTVKQYIKELLRYIQLKLEEGQQKRIMEHADRVIVFSRNVKDQILNGQICNLDKVQICYPGVSKKISGKRNVDGDAKAPTFLFVGRLVAEKNLDMLIDSFSMLSCPGKKLLIVGDGVLKYYLPQTAFEYGVKDDVIFVGETQTPEVSYEQGDFFVLPSTYESFGQVIVEAMTAGVPVIGFPTIPGKTMTAIDELIEDQRTGFVCSDFSEDALHNCLTEAAILFQNKNAYKQMRENCIRFAEENFSWKQLADACISQ